MLKRVGHTIKNTIFMLPENFPKILLGALIHVGNAIVKLLLLPFNLWVKAIVRLADQKERGLLNISSINGLWPFLSFCKRLLIDFIFDAVTFLSYPLGLIFALYVLIDGFDAGAEFAFIAFISTLITVYIYPVFMAVAHDLLELSLLPIRKCIDYFRKPAQQLDIDIKNRE